MRGCAEHLTRPVFDHSLILLDLGGLRKGPTTFKFENMWLREETFKRFIGTLEAGAQLQWFFCLHFGRKVESPRVQFERLEQRGVW